MKYKKRPEEVEAFRYGYDEFPDWFLAKFNIPDEDDLEVEYPPLFIKCKDSIKKASLGDFILRNYDKSFNVLKAQDFFRMYEK